MNQGIARTEGDVVHIGDLYEGLVEMPRSPVAAVLFRFAGRTILDVTMVLNPVLLSWIAVSVIRDSGIRTATQIGLVAAVILALVAFWVAAFMARRAEHAKNCQNRLDTPAQPRNDRGRAKAVRKSQR